MLVNEIYLPNLRSADTFSKILANFLLPSDAKTKQIIIFLIPIFRGHAWSPF